MKKKRFMLLGLLVVLLVFVMGVASASAAVTWNPNDKSNYVVLTNNNLTASSSFENWVLVRATDYVNSGKWYWEIRIDNNHYKELGIANSNCAFSPSPTNNALVWVLYPGASVLWPGSISYGDLSIVTGDIIGIALDLDDSSGKLEFYKNGVSMGVASTSVKTSVPGNIYPAVLMRNNQSLTANFGATPFSYSVPAGYQPYNASQPTPAPTNLTATAGNAQVTLNWTTVTGAISYNVKRATANNGPYTQIASGVTSASYTDTSLTNGTTYYYVVSAVNTGGESANSTEVSATPYIVLNPPTGLTATAGNTQIDLNWTAVTGATSYKVKRASTTGGPYTQIASGVTSVSYTDTSLTNGTTYYYVVSAVNSSGESANSTEVSASPNVIINLPTGLTATAGNAQIALNWTVVTGATNYNVKRAEATGGPYTQIASGITSASYTDTAVVNGTAYYYVVTAVISGVESGNSNEASATPAPTASGNGTLIITVENNSDREYNLTTAQIQAFIDWYNNRSTGGNVYIIEKTATAPYTNVKDYLIFDKIVAWQVKTY